MRDGNVKFVFDRVLKGFSRATRGAATSFLLFQFECRRVRNEQIVLRMYKPTQAAHAVNKDLSSHCFSPSNTGQCHPGRLPSEITTSEPTPGLSQERKKLTPSLSALYRRPCRRSTASFHEFSTPHNWAAKVAGQLSVVVWFRLLRMLVKCVKDASLRGD